MLQFSLCGLSAAGGRSRGCPETGQPKGGSCQDCRSSHWFGCNFGAFYLATSELQFQSSSTTGRCQSRFSAGRGRFSLRIRAAALPASLVNTVAIGAFRGHLDTSTPLYVNPSTDPGRCVSWAATGDPFHTKNTTDKSAQICSNLKETKLIKNHQTVLKFSWFLVAPGSWMPCLSLAWRL